MHAYNDDIVSNESYIPNKRLYPETCDFEFTKALVRAKVNMPWTTFSERNPLRSKFYGKTIGDFSENFAVHALSKNANK